MTPATSVARKYKVSYRLHEYRPNVDGEGEGDSAWTARQLRVPEDRVYKTWVVNVDGKGLTAGIVPASSQLNMERLARLLGASRAEPADNADIERFTGYLAEGISPLGHRQPLRTIIDSSATRHRTIYVSAGRRGMEIELKPSDLGSIVNGIFAEIASR